MRLIRIYAFLSFSVAAVGDIPAAGANAKKAAVQNAGPTLFALYAYGINPSAMATDAATPCRVLTNAAPGVFLENFATGQPAILNQDGTLNSPAHPARVGSLISIFGTGGDFVFGGVPDGELWPAMPLTPFSSPVVVTFDGVAGDVLYGGSAPELVNGVFQINARVPAVASNMTIQFSSGQTSFPVPIFVE